MMKKSTQPLVRFASASLIAACSLLPLSSVFAEETSNAPVATATTEATSNTILQLHHQSLQQVKLLKTHMV
jgi:biopolymer transport protein ExbB